jgi:hypothetical protein
MLMTIQAVMERTGARLLTPDAALDREVTAGYSCDMLSWVMGRGEAGMAWVTVQTHMNVIAVAELVDAACVLLADCGQVDEAVLQRAREDGFPLLASDKSAFALSGLLWEAGIREPVRS